MGEAKSSRPATLAIDIGGSGLKMIVLDPRGKAVTERLRLPTPAVPTPETVMKLIEELARQQGLFDRVSAGFPGVVVKGEIRTAVNMHPDWVGFNLAKALRKITGRPTRVANDADIQGWGVIEGNGVEMVITLGTGMGAALFVDGRLVPNLELGHHPFRKGRTYEDCLGEAGYHTGGRRRWNHRLAEAIDLLQRIFNYRLLYLGGGNTKKIDIPLPSNTKLVPNIAGLTGGIALWR